MNRIAALLSSLAAAVLTTTAHAAESELPKHGPEAPDDRFPSHVFRLEAHQPDRPQLAFHAGLSQPLFAHGFNAAVDLRWRRLVLTYSHGQGLDSTSFLTDAERAQGMRLALPWTTGGGIGVLLFDEVWALADVKVHRFEAETAEDHRGYTTVTVGGELGWRFFVWKGLNVAVVARYWPNVYASSGDGVVLRGDHGSFTHAPQKQGFDGFVPNVLLGWAFNL